MADITLGQIIDGSWASTDAKIITNGNQDPNLPLVGKFYDDYDLKGVTDFTQLSIEIDRPVATAGKTVLQLINSATGAIVAADTSLNATGKLSINQTTFAGVNYKIRVIDDTAGDYKLSLIDGGKATSIISLSGVRPSGDNVRNIDKYDGVGTLGANGKFFALANSGTTALRDVALGSNGQFYGIQLIGTQNFLVKIDPSLDLAGQVTATSEIKDAQGNALNINLNSLEFGPDNKLYSIGVLGTIGKFYQIDVTTKVATAIANLPPGLGTNGDLVYDAANNQFLATSEGNGTDFLWRIPVANPLNATKLDIGFTNIRGLDLVDGQLNGFSYSAAAGTNQISINTTTGVGTLVQNISGIDGIYGASTILASTTPPVVVTPPPVVVTPPPVTGTRPDIILGQVINGAFTTNDVKIVSNGNQDPNLPLNGKYYDDYDLKNISSFTQLSIEIDRPAGTTSKTVLQLINAKTGAIVGEDGITGSGKLSLNQTTFTGINYKIRVIDDTVGNYKLTLKDGGKATSVVSLTGVRPDGDPVRSINKNNGVGTIGADGTFFALANTGTTPFRDVALSSTAQLYGIQLINNQNFLVKIDPSVDLEQQVSLTSNQGKLIKDAQGNALNINLNSLEFGLDNKLYSIGVVGTVGKFYQIDVATNVATSIADLPPGLGTNGDLVYDAVNKQFIATSEGDPTTDYLWLIPEAAPLNATKVDITGGFKNVRGISFVDGQLTGFSYGAAAGTNQISINPTTGVGTLVKNITGVDGIYGASTILASTITTPPVIVDPPVVVTPPPVVVTPPPVVVTPPPVVVTPPPVVNTDPIAGISLTNNFFKTNSTVKGFGVSVVSQKTNSVNEIGVFAIEDVVGKAGGSLDYFKAAINSAKSIFSTLGGDFLNKNKREISLSPNKTYGFFEIKDGSISDAFQQIAAGKVPTNIIYALPDGSANSPIKVTSNGANNGYKVSVNNDDLVLNVVKLDSLTASGPIGSKSQGSAEGRTIDVRDYAGKALKVDITTKSDAAYTNNIGFYAVEDAIGTIKLANGSFLKPGDANYALEAVKSAGLRAGKTDSKLNQDLSGGKIYAPVLVAQGTLDDFIAKNPTDGGVGNTVHAYFNYVGANSDKVDHFRLTGNNTFAVEDTYGGGDRDFNDGVISVNVKIA